MIQIRRFKTVSLRYEARYTTGRAGLPGTRHCLKDFYKVRFQLGAAVGRSVMYARDGRMLGGNLAFAHIGTYEKRDDGVDIVIQTVSP